MIYALQALLLIVVAAWGVVVFSLIQVIGLAPDGKKISVLMDVGWWKHGKVVAAVGPSAEAPLKRYRMGFYVFFGMFFVAAISVFALTI